MTASRPANLLRATLAGTLFLLSLVLLLVLSLVAGVARACVSVLRSAPAGRGTTARTARADAPPAA